MPGRASRCGCLALVASIAAAYPPHALADSSGAAPSSQPASRSAPAQLATPAPAAAPALQFPLGGFSDGVAFLRSPDGTFVLLPNGRVQVDGYLFKNPTEASSSKHTFAVKRARLELFGWIGSRIGFNIAGDFAAGPTAAANPIAPSAQNATDDFVLVAPLGGAWRDTLLFQLGQFDAPFTLENRTSDKYFDLVERSLTVRAFGIPTNKELGLMAHGLLPNKLVYYSLGVFNGDGQNFKNVDNRFDVMGRAWIAPFALVRDSILDHLTVGGSFLVGDRKDGLPLASQATVAGFKFLDPKWASPLDAKVPFELHQNGDLRAYAVELDAPIAHRLGVRLEFVYKDQKLQEYDVSAATSGKLTPVGGAAGARLKGWSLYAQAWAWIVGDDTIVGRPGLQLPVRMEKMAVQRPRHGLQVLARVERLDEEITSDAPANGNPLVGHTRVTSMQLGATYWYTKRFRAMLNYDLNVLGSDAGGGAPTANTAGVWSKLGGKHWEHEVLLRLGIAL